MVDLFVDGYFELSFAVGPSFFVVGPVQHFDDFSFIVRTALCEVIGYILTVVLIRACTLTFRKFSNIRGVSSPTEIY